MKKYKWNMVTAAMVLSACLGGCSGGRADPAVEYADEALVIYCPHPLEFINPVVSEFEARTGIQVEVHTGGTGELLLQAEQEEECDVFWGGSLSTTIQKAELFEPYISKNEPAFYNEFKNTEGCMTRFTDIPSVLMVNTNLLGDITVEGYKDLLNPKLKGRIAMCNPATSSSAFEHLINMLYAMGNGDPEQGWPYVEQFCANLDGKLLSGSSAVYEGVAKGQYAVGLTFEEAAAHYTSKEGPIQLIYMKEGVISKPDVVCIVKGTRHLADARDFVDFVTGKDAQTVISAELKRRSVRADVEEPDYLPDKRELYLIEDNSVVVNENKNEWLRHFLEIYQDTLGQ